jgi:hypothetical protein
MPEASVATWILVLAIICGMLILSLIAMVLYKVRQPFFKVCKTNKTGLTANVIRVYAYYLRDNIVGRRHADVWWT